jgi:hypothetical protein
MILVRSIPAATMSCRSAGVLNGPEYSARPDGRVLEPLLQVHDGFLSEIPRLFPVELAPIDERVPSPLGSVRTRAMVGATSSARRSILE